MIEHITNEASRSALVCKIKNLPEGDYTVTIEKKKKQRTPTQNASFHLWCEVLAGAFNLAGIDKRQVFEKMKKGIEIPWTKESVKEDFFKPIMEAVTGKKSTTELTTKEISEVVDIINHEFLSKRFNGMRVEWPSENL